MLLEIIYTILFPIILYGLYTYINHIFETRKYPAGPFPLPIIGNLHQLSKEPYKSFLELGKTYGDVFSISFGMQRVVIVNTYEPAMEALLTKSRQFAGRPTNVYPYDITSRGYKNIGFSGLRSSIDGFKKNSLILH